MQPMGRRPTTNLNLPSRMRARQQKSGLIYYYYDTGKKPRVEIPLGKNYPAAVKKWAELEADGLPKASKLITFKDVVDEYRKLVIPKKSARTQDDNNVELNKLLEFFGNPPAPLEEIKPLNIREYLDWRTGRGAHSTVRANRERALFSHIWNKAREWGVTDKENPCKGVTGFTEQGRDIYIEDNILNAVYVAADQPTKDALDLAYLTGQRPADVIAMSEMHIANDLLSIDQGKTNKKLRMSIEGKLKALINRIKLRKQACKVHSLALICTETGRPMTYPALRKRFDTARIKAAKDNPKLKDDIEAFQFRDLRAKAGTDKADTGDMRQAQMQLGHSDMKMTEHYVRSRRGDIVSPTK
jgi:integrase